MNEIADPVAAPERRIHRIWNQIWPQATIGFGFAFTIIWVFILGKGLVALIYIALS